MIFLQPEQYVPQATVDRRPLLMWLGLTGGALLLIALILTAPLAAANQDNFLAAALYQGFGYVCHQQPERSFFLAGHQLAVCSRCTGIYFGFVALTLLYPALLPLRSTAVPERKWLVLAAVPLAIDFALGFLGIWENTHTSRFLTGALFGGVVVLYLLPALAELSLRLGRGENRNASVPPAMSA
jgi:uncharacterized membrane protein